LRQKIVQICRKIIIHDGQSMIPNVVFQPIAIAASSADTDGRLLLVDGRLAAVLVRLQDEVHDDRLQGKWFVESAFGDLAESSGDATFATLEEAADWIRKRQSRAHAPAAPGNAAD
jgi:hypothetical protein